MRTANPRPWSEQRTPWSAWQYINMKATDWITYSFDVKMDGKNACRHTDKKFHNNKNTVDCQGNVDAIPPGLPPKELSFAVKCSKQRKKYKKLQHIEGHHKAEAIGNLEAIPRDRNARIRLEGILQKKIDMAEQVIVERRKYVDMGCDRVDWYQRGRREEDKKRSHLDEIDNVRAHIAKMRRQIAGLR